MKQRERKFPVLAVLMALLFSLFTTACDEYDHPEQEEVNERTLLMFFPYSGLYNYIQQNIADMKTSIQSCGLKNQRVVVFLATSSTQARLFELELENGSVNEVELDTFTGMTFSSVDEMSTLFAEVKSLAPANSYSMIVGSHGKGWIPKSRASDYTSRAYDELSLSDEWKEWYSVGERTRFFGTGSSTSINNIDTTDFAEALLDAGMYMEYITFDDCYMASMEVAYDLKEVTHYLVGSTCEMMNYGLPYTLTGQYFLGTPNYSKICSEFLRFYSDPTAFGVTDSEASGTLSVTDCTQVDAMAELMKRINAHDTFDSANLSKLQRLDGYTPIIFFDFGSYVENLCTDASLRSEFDDRLAALVPYKVNTATYYTSLLPGFVILKTYSGLTISDPSTSSVAVAKTNTGWWKATH